MDKVREKLLDIAKTNPMRYKFAAGLIYKNKLQVVGLNKWKTHPIMLQGDYKEHQVHLHAEADLMVRAKRFLTEDFISSCSVLVVRVDKSGKQQLAKPCVGCMGLITEYGIKDISWTVGERHE